MNVFDILGPVMIGPSSSHTAGAARLGLITRRLLGTEPRSAEIVFHGSFAKTYKGHGTDKAVIAGIMDMTPDNPDLRHSMEIAADRGIDISITTAELENAHPNTARITLTDEAGNSVTLQGSSIGGGNIRVDYINGMPVSLSGQYLTLIVLHRDTPGVIATVTELLSAHGANICSFHLARQEKGGVAVMTIEIDSKINCELPVLKEELERDPEITTCTAMLPIS
ncbi:L-serine ammonia-lyase, iron-sulfur-dependent subunit beta [Eubacterium pyruvativorans]|uniref:L-serine ammonia-lyase, iron-sulfur-dependent subunit beta n=1 Tax=Eubacterium pyruvativorans TaxID=155865 RepID=UPI0015698437|nr:L-serine ammonia-lyase, iron-sulfur-dependent subunit beta [Eubacterium pyruvativorans]